MLTEIIVKRFKAIHEVSLPLDRINILIGANNSGKSSLLQAMQFAVSVAQTVKVLGAEWRKDEVKFSFAPAQLIYAPMREIAALAPNRNFTEYVHSAIQVEFIETRSVANRQQTQSTLLTRLRQEIEGHNRRYYIEAAPTISDVEYDALCSELRALEDAHTEPVAPALPESIKISSSVRVIRGRGQNIQCTVSGSDLGRRLQPIREPFSVFVPGLAGIPTFEEQKAAATVRRAAARGDANSVFRNVLWLLKQNKVQWLQFQTDFQRVFPKWNVNVSFNTDQDEHITATVSTESGELPIDAAGTGVLQAIQILAYINLSKPKLLILDEPDAHLHPNNQRRLADLLVNLSELRDFQILLSTHSRHLVDALRGSARMHWIRGGKRVPDDEYDELGVLMEVGALDRGDLLKGGKIKCVVLTEDDDVEVIELLLSASGFKMDEIDIWSYKGCAKRDAAIALYAFITSHAPATKVIIHRDRDYLSDDEIAAYKAALEKDCKHVAVFVTDGTDAESHFVNSDHIRSVFPKLEKTQVDALIDRATEATSEHSIKTFINVRTDIDGSKERKLGRQLDYGGLAFKCQKDYGANPVRYRHGKRVLRKLRQILQEELKLTSSPFVSSANIKVKSLAEIAEEIWPKLVAEVDTTEPKFDTK